MGVGEGMGGVDDDDFCHVVGEVGCEGVGDETAPVVTDLRRVVEERMETYEIENIHEEGKDEEC